VSCQGKIQSIEARQERGSGSETKRNGLALMIGMISGRRFYERAGFSFS
jgi:hypothetical protein